MAEPAPDHFALLMATRDPEVRVAVIRLLHSMFVTNHDQIICKFSYYLPFFLTLLEERSTSSISYYQLTSELSDHLSSTDFELDWETLDAILHFISQCFEPPVQNAKVDAFVSHLFDPSRLLSALPRIFATQSASDHLEILFEIVVSTQSIIPFRLIRPFAQDVRRIVAARPFELMPKVIRCLLSIVPKISKFAASLAVAGVGVDGILPMFLPYIGFIRVKKPAGHSFRVLHRALTDEAFRGRVYSQPLDPGDCPFPEAKDTDARLVAEDVAQDGRILPVAEPSARGPSERRPIHAAISLSKRLEEPVERTPKRKPSPPKAEAPPIKATAPHVAGLSAVVHKLGGFQHGTWQRWLFEYHPLTKCVSWRAKKMSSIKGFLLVDQNIGLERLAKGLKGKAYVMEIRFTSKVYQIAFATQQELDKWLVTLEAARVQQ
jgi:hypothetical protein